VAVQKYPDRGHGLLAQCGHVTAAILAAHETGTQMMPVNNTSS
jgi:hypothetical protein